MAWYVYVLQCSDGSLYVGMTGDVERRLGEHERAVVKWTQTRLPVVLVRQESFSSRTEARRREKYLKSGWGKQWLTGKVRAR